MNVNLKGRQLIRLIQGIVFLNLLFLAGTFLFNYYYYQIQNANWSNGTNLKFVLMEFSLATENVLATWYSSMLFLFVGLIFFICYLLQRNNSSARNPKQLALGWLIFSGIFTLLSLDELASLHERIGNIHALNPLGDYPLGWVFMLAVPIILVVFFMIWFCLLQFKRAPVAALIGIAGIIVFGSILMQEYYEMEAWKAEGNIENWQRPVAFLLLEEGSELFGATLLLVSGVLFAYSLSSVKKFNKESTLELNFSFKTKYIIFIYAAGSLAMALLMLALINNDLLILAGDHGKRENWFPAATALLSSLLCLYLFKKAMHTGHYRIYFYLSLFSMLLSAYFGGNMYTFMQNATHPSYKTAVLVFLTITTIHLGLNLFRSVKDLYSRVAILMWTSLIIPSFFIFSWYAAALVFSAFSILFIFLLHKITSEGRPIPIFPVT